MDLFAQRIWQIRLFLPPDDHFIAQVSVKRVDLFTHYCVAYMAKLDLFEQHYMAKLDIYSTG